MTAPDRAEALVLGWGRLYTSGVVDDAGERRLQELASDCFEQRRWGREVGASPAAVATSMVARTLAGMPADLLWRQAQIATFRDRSPNPKGRNMGQWMKDNWWVAIAGVLGVMLTAMGVMLPLEEKTVGAVIGGVVIAALGVSMLVGIRVRRRDRRLGGLMIAIGTLPTLPFFWTVFLPILGLLVFIPALMDVSDAEVQGLSRHDDTSPTPKQSGLQRDPVLLAALGLLVAAGVAAFIISSQTAAAGLCSPPLALVIGRLATRRLPMASRLAALGLTGFLTGLAHAALLAVVAVGGDESIDIGDPIVLRPSVITSTVGLVGLATFIIAIIMSRGKARPA